MPICSHINFYSLTLKVHFDLLWPLWPLFGLFDNFFQLLNIHFNISNRGPSSEVTIILVISLNKFRFLGPKNGRLLNREVIVRYRYGNYVTGVEKLGKGKLFYFSSCKMIHFASWTKLYF